MSRSVAAALFDVDGTLVDSNYLHAVTWWEAFIQSGYQVPMADIHRVIGMGLLSGGISRDELAAAGAAQVYAGPGELLSALDSSLLGSGQARGSQPSVGREVGGDGSRGIS